MPEPAQAFPPLLAALFASSLSLGLSEKQFSLCLEAADSEQRVLSEMTLLLRPCPDLLWLLVSTCLQAWISLPLLSSRKLWV